jgi:phosphate/phosphite/phosphonate ABC transporter binding protein
MSTPTRLVFGLAVPESLAAADAGVGSLIRWFGAKAGVELVRFQVPSYEALARQMADGAIQVAWLPPIVFVRLEREGVAVPLVTNKRGGSGGYQSVLLVRGASKIHTLDGLQGASAAWVDPLSASGYVLPRIQLAALGIDPRTVFAKESFYGSHPAAVAALLDGSADVAATFAGLDADGASRGGRASGHPTSGAMGQASSDDDVRVLATFGQIPGDLIAVRPDVGQDVRASLSAVQGRGDGPGGAPSLRRGGLRRERLRELRRPTERDRRGGRAGPHGRRRLALLPHAAPASAGAVRVREASPTAWPRSASCRPRRAS